MASGDSFIALRQYLKGKIDKYELMDLDKAITDVRTNSQNLGQSRIRIDLGNDGALKMVGLSDDDIWFYNNVSSPYGNYEFETKDGIEQNFFDGSNLVWGMMDEDNLSLAEEISRYVYPKHFDIDDEKFMSEFSKKLNSLFEYEVDDILKDYVWEKNNEMNKVALESMNEQLEEEFERLGIKYVDSNEIETTVAELINLYMQSNLTHLSIKKMLTDAISDDSNIGGWYDNNWEYQDDEEFDKDSFNRLTYRNLRKILDEIENQHKDWADYRKLVNELTKKFHLDHWYPIPKTDDYLFSIDGFDKDTRKVIVKIRNSTNTKRETLKFSLENFYNLLYQPELFKFEDLYNL